MSGLPVLLGSGRSPYQCFIQIEDSAIRLPADAFGQAVENSPSMLALFLRYAQASSVQVAHTALSNAIHTINERLARWLLMCHDRLPTDEIALTHDFMALMLGTRRSSVTIALQTLEGSGLVRAVRGKVTVRDRLGLEEFAGDAYGAPEAEYERLIGPMPRTRVRPA
jgi:CRP-like cAMP-binding protein